MPTHHANEQKTDTTLQPAPTQIQQQQQQHKPSQKQHQELSLSQHNVNNALPQDSKDGNSTTNVIIPQPAFAPAPPSHTSLPPPSVEDIFGPPVTAPVFANNDKTDDSNANKIFDTNTKPVVSVDKKGLLEEQKAAEAMIQQDKAHDKDEDNAVKHETSSSVEKNSMTSDKTTQSSGDVNADADVAATATEPPSVNSTLTDQAESSAPQHSITLPSSTSSSSPHSEAGKETLPLTKEESALNRNSAQMQSSKDDKSKKDDNNDDDDDDCFDAFLNSHATN